MIKIYKSLQLFLIVLLGLNFSTSAQTSTFSYTGSPAFYTVPAGVTAVSVTAMGAQGGANSDPGTYPDRPGYGACVNAIIVVTPGQVLTVNAGGCGNAGITAAGGAGGYNGGGNGSNGLGAFSGGGGGGHTDVSYGATLLMVAGGGGGAGENCSTGNADRGGDGGGAPSGTLTGETGAACGVTVTGGGGGSTSSPGIGGVCGGCLGTSGSAGFGQNGGSGGSGSAGGGGGGGYLGGGGGQWSGGGGGGDYTAPGVYFQSETRGCNSACGQVSITPYCTHGSISGPDSICSGTGYTFTEDQPGGTWSSAFGYVTFGSPTGSPTTVTGTTGSSPRVDTIYYTLIAGSPTNPACVAKFVVTINPVPSPITSTPPIALVCVGTTLALSDPTLSGVWSSVDTSIAKVDSSTGIVTGRSTGTTTISYTVSTGCAATFGVIVNPAPSAISGPSLMCMTSPTITLTDPDLGSWASSGSISIATSGSAATVTGTGVGVGIVSFTSGGCTVVHPVTVSALPSPITGFTRVCMGSTITAGETDAGGLWSSSVPAVATIGSASGIISPVTTGTTTVCYTFTAPPGCAACETVTVNPVPPAISGPSVVCVNSTIILGDAISGSWSSSLPGTATATIGPGTATTVTGVAAGVATISLAASSTGCYATHDVTVNPIPTALTGPASLCVGQTATYTTTPAPPLGTWSISSGGGFGSIVGGTGFFTAGPGFGNVTIRYTITSTGCSLTRVVTVNQNPTISIGTGAVCVGSAIVYTVTPTTGGTWSSPDDPTLVTGVAGITTSTVSITGASAGVATISYTLATSCATSASLTVNPTPLPFTGTVAQMCVGDKVTYGETVTGGTWSSSAGAVATVGTGGLVTAVGTGVATIDYTMPTGCFASFTVTVNAIPGTFSLVPFRMCTSDPPTVITTSGGAGTWTSQVTTVATVTGAGTTATVNVLSAGTDSICYQFTAAPGCRLCEQLTVNTSPSPITGPSTVCVGQQVTVNATPSGGSWTFTAGTGNIAPIVGGVIRGTSAGTVTVTYTTGATCFVTYPMTVMPSPAAITASPSFNICQGQSTTLSDATGGGTWSIGVGGTGSGTIVPVGTICTVTGTGAGTVIISYTLASDGCPAVATVTVTSLATAITGPSSVCTGSNITLSEATGPGTWSIAPFGLATVVAGPSFNTTVTGTAPGTATVTYTYLGCQTSKTITVNQTPTALITPLGSTDLCPGDVVALTATTGVGYTYTWLDPGVIGGAFSSSYTTGTAATYSVTVSTAFCSATSPGVTVAVHAITAGVSVLGALTTCASTPPVLTATPPGMSYQWEDASGPIAGLVTGVFTPTASGTYDVVVTNTWGCSSTSPAQVVTLIPSPTAVVTVSGPLNFCTGSSVTFSTPFVTGNTYQWYNTGAPITGATNNSFTATLAGTYTVQVSNSIGCTTTSASSVVTVTSGPAATIIAGGDLIFCAGGGVPLTAPAGAGLAYQWYKNGTAIAGATTLGYVATTSGSFTVVVTSTATGCSTTSSPTTVTEALTPVIQPLSATVFCWGGSVTLSATTTAGVGTITYQWYKNGTLIPGATNVTYAATTTGNYTVQVTLTGLTTPCSMTSAPTSVTENPLPNPLVTFDGTYFHTGTFATYQWYKNTIAISGATTNMVHNSGPGSYYVIVTDANGCQSASANYVLGTHTGVPNTNNNLDVHIYPNPAQSSIHIEADQPLRTIICGMDGRTLIDRSDAKDINISSLADGIYVIKLFDENGELVKTDKLVKSSN